jgi:tripeptidyl-peptidase-1
LSSKEVIDFFAPAAESVDAVTEWLKSAGFAADRISQSANKQWMQFDATAAEAEDLLFTEFSVYEHRQTGTQNVACDEYHIPAHIKEHIDYITPGIRLRVDPGKAKKAKREIEADNLQKRGVKTMNTGAIPIFEAGPALPPLNSSVCDKYVTNQCVRSKF